MPERKAAQRLLAFDDLLNRLDQALQGPVGEDLAASLRATYPLALIDEFQDTDPIQYAIFNRIYAKGRDASLCFVGDPKQAIYAFRGADLAHMTAKQQADREPLQSADQLPLDARADRRAQPAVRPSAAVRPTRPALSCGGCRRQAACEPASGRGGRAAPLSLVWLGDDPLGKAEAAQLAAADTARRIAVQLAAAAEGRAGFAQGDRFTPIKGSDIAVLVANHRQAGMIADELAARGVPSVRRGRDSVWRSEEAGELAAVLAAYAEPGREGLLRHALATRPAGPQRRRSRPLPG